MGAVAFRRLIALFHNVFFAGRFSFVYDTLQHTAASPWGVWIILAPAIGGLGVAWMVKNFAPEAKGHGVPEVMDAIYYQNGYMRPQVVLIKAVASSLNIGSGGSVGREGPIIQMGAAFAANLSRWLRLEAWQRYALIAAGAGGGIAATFNTPIGGMLFAVELMMPEISARTLVPVMIATGTATYVSRLFLGHHPAFIVPPLHIAATASTSPEAFFAYLLLGLIIGLVALLFMRSIYWFEDRFDALPGNYYTRHVLGMLLVGVTLYLLLRTTGHYFVEGVGYATVQDVLNGRLEASVLLLLVLAALKLLVTSLTLGSGGSGGVFSPSLFIGATLGGAFALVAHGVDPSLELNVITAASLGMAAMVGAGTGAAMTGAVMIFEMTGDYRIILPLIVVGSVAYATRRLITADTIYTLKLTRRGHDVPESRQSNLYLDLPAREFVSHACVQVPVDAPWPPPGLRRFSPAGLPHLLLVDAHGAIAGVVPAQRVAGQWRARGLETRALALDEWQAVAADTLIVDLLGSVRREGAETFLLGRDGAAPTVAADVEAILVWSDVVQAAGLPTRERMHGGTAGT
ncbi:chloride channel protein [Acidihalobacter ferrooxydans]|uniref:Chloride channel protein n=1 Tax=Acidihalobacter ferrooxydans TaxID=1765967 RepID=A0A1P8UL59_9GAMM|nr:chloride channel protein [Acidihalobacter ferrooxydans]